MPVVAMMKLMRLHPLEGAYQQQSQQQPTPTAGQNNHGRQNQNAGKAKSKPEPSKNYITSKSLVITNNQNDGNNKRPLRQFTPLKLPFFEPYPSVAIGQRPCSAPDAKASARSCPALLEHVGLLCFPSRSRACYLLLY